MLLLFMLLTHTRTLSFSNQAIVSLRKHENSHKGKFNIINCRFTNFIDTAIKKVVIADSRLIIKDEIYENLTKLSYPPDTPYPNAYITNCSFINCSTNSKNEGGGAILLSKKIDYSANDILIQNCIFDHCKCGAKNKGGAVSVRGYKKCEIFDSNFSYCAAKQGGSVSIEAAIIRINSSMYMNSTASLEGAAIYTFEGRIEIKWIQLIFCGCTHKEHNTFITFVNSNNVDFENCTIRDYYGNYSLFGVSSAILFQNSSGLIKLNHICFQQFDKRWPFDLSKDITFYPIHVYTEVTPVEVKVGPEGILPPDLKYFRGEAGKNNTIYYTSHLVKINNFSLTSDEHLCEQREFATEEFIPSTNFTCTQTFNATLTFTSSSFFTPEQVLDTTKVGIGVGVSALIIVIIIIILLILFRKKERVAYDPDDIENDLEVAQNRELEPLFAQPQQNEIIFPDQIL